MKTRFLSCFPFGNLENLFFKQQSFFDVLISVSTDFLTDQASYLLTKLEELARKKLALKFCDGKKRIPSKDYSSPHDLTIDLPELF